MGEYLDILVLLCVLLLHVHGLCERLREEGEKKKEKLSEGFLYMDYSWRGLGANGAVQSSCHKYIELN